MVKFGCFGFFFHFLKKKNYIDGNAQEQNLSKFSMGMDLCKEDTAMGACPRIPLHLVTY